MAGTVRLSDAINVNVGFTVRNWVLPSLPDYWRGGNEEDFIRQKVGEFLNPLYDWDISREEAEKRIRAAFADKRTTLERELRRQVYLRQNKETIQEFRDCLKKLNQ